MHNNLVGFPAAYTLQTLSYRPSTIKGQIPTNGNSNAQVILYVPDLSIRVVKGCRIPNMMRLDEASAAGSWTASLSPSFPCLTICIPATRYHVCISQYTNDVLFEVTKDESDGSIQSWKVESNFCAPSLSLLLLLLGSATLCIHRSARRSHRQSRKSGNQFHQSKGTHMLSNQTSI